MSSPLFTPLQAGALALPNRILMAPLTRGRATKEGVPTPLMAEYYKLRADAGLIITEATAISQQGYGWAQAPGMFTDAQEKGWEKVTHAVHQAGGRIVLQLWHMGRVSHPDFQHGALPVGPSAIAAKGHSHTPSGLKPYVTPHALSQDEITAIIADYVTATKRAMHAGFDGVEIHSANGYLIDQFLRDGSNKRSDSYGGSPANRTRLLREVTEAVTAVIGAGKAGVRLSPKNETNGMSDSDPAAIFGFAAEMLNGFGLAYLHVLEGLPGHFLAAAGERITPVLRKAFKNTLIANGGYDQAKGEQAIAKGEVDAITYGTLFIANADLVQRFKSCAPLNAPDKSTFYTHGAEGYIDYPLLNIKAA